MTLVSLLIMICIIIVVLLISFTFVDYISGGIMKLLFGINDNKSVNKFYIWVGVILVILVVVILKILTDEK